MPLRLVETPLASAYEPRLSQSLLSHVFPVPARSRPAGSRSATALFHTTARLRDDQIDKAGNHYEALKLHPGATPAEIKK